jgi:hypothetical protein
MQPSSPSSPCPPGTVDIELEVGDHEVDAVFRDPGLNPLIVARSVQFEKPYSKIFCALLTR